jgi:hypothetical protein
LLCAVPLALAAAGARADLYVYEPFSYTPSQSLANLNGGQGFSGAWGAGVGGPTTITGSSIPIVGLDVAGNKVSFTPNSVAGSSDSTSRRNLATTFGTPGTIYVSYAYQYVDGNRYAGLTLLNNSTQSAFFGKNSGQPNWRVTSPFAATVDSGIPITTDPTLLVLKIEFNQSGNNERLSLFVNPTPGAAEPTPVVQTTSTSTFFFNQIELGSGANNTTFSTTRASFDEIRISNTWAEAVPVPEPSTLALVAAAATALAAAGWRKSSGPSEPA